MIDQSKRNTLKNLAAIGAGTAAVTVSSGVLAHSTSASDTSAALALRTFDNNLVKINIGARLASVNNDLEVVITNTSDTTATITDMTPAQLNTARGHFDFNALFDSGDLRLAAGESVSVPIKHHAVVLSSSSIDERAAELTQGLRRNVSIIIDGDSFAATSVAKFANFA